MGMNNTIKVTTCTDDVWCFVCKQPSSTTHHKELWFRNSVTFFCPMCLRDLRDVINESINQ